MIKGPEMGSYPGLSGWALSAITCIPTKGEAEGELALTEEGQQDQEGRDRSDAAISQGSLAASQGRERQGRDLPLGPPQGAWSC